MKKIIYDIYRLVIFYLKLVKIGAFTKHNPIGILLVIKEYVLSESTVFNASERILCRTHEQNAQLLCNLIDTYIKTKSKATLEQILEVLKMTIVKGK